MANYRVAVAAYKTDGLSSDELRAMRGNARGSWVLCAWFHVRDMTQAEARRAALAEARHLYPGEKFKVYKIKRE